MALPQNIMKNTEALLALLSAIGGALGMLLVAIAYAAVSFSIQSADSAVSPQLDSASAAISDASQLARDTAQSTRLVSQGYREVSSALAKYSESTGNASESMISIAAVPPFSLDSRFSNAAKGLRSASQDFSIASSSLLLAASSADNSTESMRTLSEDLGKASLSLSYARKDFKGALFMLNMAALCASFALLILFSSVIMVSISILLSHYPRLFGGSNQAAMQQAEPTQKQERKAAHWQPGQAHRQDDNPEDDPIVKSNLRLVSGSKQGI